MTSTIEDFNLLVSTSRGNELNTCSEMWYLLGELGDRGCVVDKTPISGLVVAKTKIPPHDAVLGLRQILYARPWEFKYVLKVIPILVVAPAAIDAITKDAIKLSKHISSAETFRITIHKRHSYLSSKDLINNVASKIERRVNLGNPDKVLLIEILGSVAGISIVKDEHILSIEREKRKALNQSG